jgi:hypothetical protein
VQLRRLQRIVANNFVALKSGHGADCTPRICEDLMSFVLATGTQVEARRFRAISLMLCDADHMVRVGGRVVSPLPFGAVRRLIFGLRRAVA